MQFRVEYKRVSIIVLLFAKRLFQRLTTVTYFVY